MVIPIVLNHPPGYSWLLYALGTAEWQMRLPNALSTVLAGELGPQQIRVNAVAPGMIDTSRMDDVPRGQVWDAVVRANIPLQRAGTGADIAHIVVFLCSEQAAWVTGQTFTVDGGHGHAPRG